MYVGARRTKYQILQRVNNNTPDITFPEPTSLNIPPAGESDKQ